MVVDIMHGIPIATLGRNREVAQQLQESLAPEYDIVHACLDLESAKQELPDLCAGIKQTSSVSKLGSNEKREAVDERKIPRAVVLGGNFKDFELDVLKTSIETKTHEKGVPNPHFIEITPADMMAVRPAGATAVSAAGGPDPAVLAKIVRAKLGELRASGQL